MKIQIRRAEKKDCKRLLELVKELAIYERAADEVTATLEHFEESGFGVKPVWWGFVATAPSPRREGCGEAIIGFIMYYIRYSTWKGQRMYLEDFIVTEQARSKGVGKMLFDRLIEEAKEKKFNGIVWQVLDWNEQAINFYKKYNAKFEKEWINCSIEIFS
ncbi:MAG: GNAT family N-acetyltransferase [Chitinophagaceae bacterium]